MLLQTADEGWRLTAKGTCSIEEGCGGTKLHYLPLQAKQGRLFLFLGEIRSVLATFNFNKAESSLIYEEIINGKLMLHLNEESRKKQKRQKQEAIAWG